MWDYAYYAVCNLSFNPIFEVVLYELYTLNRSQFVIEMNHHEPGECVSVDQMESPTAGFIAQMKGKLTKGRYKYATVYIDHYSR